MYALPEETQHRGRKARNDHFILKGRISVRRQCYLIQPGTAALYNKRKIAVLGTHGNETKALLPAKRMYRLKRQQLYIMQELLCEEGGRRTSPLQATEFPRL